jgi:phosphatidylinositol N-acetylglucosaminyltransferase subunit A
VRGVLCRGHIFLNCSLTDSFCIAILEAAACGLHVVATAVGGVPEVLPPDMVTLSEPTVEALVAALTAALQLVEAEQLQQAAAAQRRHDRVAAMYSWADVAQR